MDFRRCNVGGKGGRMGTAPARRLMRRIAERARGSCARSTYGTSFVPLERKQPAALRHAVAERLNSSQIVRGVRPQSHGVVALERG